MNTNNKGMENESLEQRVARLELQLVELSECCKSLAGYSALNVGSAGVRAMVERINKIFSNTGETNESNEQILLRQKGRERYNDDGNA